MVNSRVLIIIVTYNAMPWAERCFDSLKASSALHDVFVVDNGSSDGSQKFIQERYPDIIFHQSETNLGFGRANNIGLQYAIEHGYDYVYLLNQDAWVMPETFEELITISQKHPEYGILSPMQMKADCKHLDGNFIKNVLLCEKTKEPYFIEDAYFNQLEEVYEVDFVMAAHWFITRKCLETVGGFSPTFPHYGEDSNFIHRAKYWDFKVGIVPNSRAVHDRGDAHWSKEKQTYIEEYIGDLIGYSNPYYTPRSRWFSLVRKCMVSIILGNKMVKKYNIRLLKERNYILNNYKLSLRKKAFLK